MPESPPVRMVHIAAWILHLRGHGAPIKDPAADAARAAAANPDFTSAVSGVLDTWDPESRLMRSS
jgi:fructuronate reductase